ncbi:hypothetical protein AAK882_06325 [Carnobacteriaceae bacterium 52-44]
MKKSNGKFFVGIGILLIIAGVLIFSDDSIIGVIGIIFGLYNVVKGIRLLRGIQPLLIRKQQERYKDEEKELENKFDETKRRNEKHNNKK